MQGAASSNAQGFQNCHSEERSDVGISQYPAASWESDRQNRNCLPEIATGAKRPRNDKSGGQCGRRGTQESAAANGAHYPQGARRIRKAAKPPTAAQGAPLQTQSVGTFYRYLVRTGSAFPRLPRAQSALAMTNLLALRHRIRAAKPTACKALNPRKGDAASVRRQSRQRLRRERRYRRNRLVRFYRQPVRIGSAFPRLHPKGTSSRCALRAPRRPSASSQ